MAARTFASQSQVQASIKHCVYRIYDDHGLIYVGSSSNLFQRMAAHRRDSWWAPTVVKVRAECCPSREASRAREVEVILAERPRWNRQEQRGRRDEWSVEEFEHYVISWLQEALHKIGRGARGEFNDFEVRRLRRHAYDFERRYGMQLDFERLGIDVPALLTPPRIA